MALKRKSNRVAKLPMNNQMRRQQKDVEERPSKMQEKPLVLPSLPMKSIRQEQMSEEEDTHVEPSAPETQVQLFMNSKC